MCVLYFSGASFQIWKVISIDYQVISSILCSLQKSLCLFKLFQLKILEVISIDTIRKLLLILLSIIMYLMLNILCQIAPERYLVEFKYQLQLNPLIHFDRICCLQYFWTCLLAPWHIRSWYPRDAAKSGHLAPCTGAVQNLNCWISCTSLAWF